MKNILRLLILQSILVICFSQNYAATSYLSPKAQEIVEKMVAAHGRMAK